MFKIGADPELFLRDKKTKKYVSAHDIIPGTKKKPALMDDPYGATVQADGTALEYNLRPAINAETFLTYHVYAINSIKKLIPDHLELVATPEVVYPLNYFKSLPPIATELGCDPDFNAYTGLQNVIPTPKEWPSMRTGAGHIHIGWHDKPIEDEMEDGHFNDCRILVQNLDKAFKLIGPDAGATDKRTLLYGKDGAFRPKKYGVEYRVPSNRWTHSRATAYKVARLAIFVTEYTMKHGLDRCLSEDIKYAMRYGSFYIFDHKGLRMYLPFGSHERKASYYMNNTLIATGDK